MPPRHEHGPRWALGTRPKSDYSLGALSAISRRHDHRFARLAPSSRLARGARARRTLRGIPPRPSRPPFHMNSLPAFRPELAAAGVAALPSPRDEEHAMAARFRAGSPGVWSELMSHYRGRLYVFAYRMTRNHHDAEDLVQETFVRAFRAAAGFRGDAALSSWLHTIARNVAHNRYWHWRRRKGDVTVSLDSPEAAADTAAWHQTATRDERETFAHHELEQSIAQALERLAPRDRDILELRTRQHASYEAIARALGISIGTVKSRLARARERLRAAVEAAGGFEARAESLRK